MVCARHANGPGYRDTRLRNRYLCATQSDFKKAHWAQITGKAEQLLWATCAELASQGISAFPFAGTLLGIVRDGRLLDFDKDLDIAVCMESWEACCQALEKMGWRKVSMGLPYSNYRDYVHAEMGISLDLCGLQRRNAQQIVGGFSLPGATPQTTSVFPYFRCSN